MNRWSALALLVILAGALALRLSDLSVRPLHNDEAVNAVKVGELWQDGHYVYDPDEYHGPTLHYATLPFLWLSGAHNPGDLDDSVLRIAPVVFGVGLILLLLLLVDGLGRPAVFWAAIFTAVSPAMVFYSRYFIHEMPLVFFTALAIGAGWRYSQTRSACWAFVAGAGLGLMAGTKETFVLALAAMGLALIATIWTATAGQNRLQSLRSFWNWKHAALAFGAAFMVWLLLFSSFFTNAAGPGDSVRTYLPWLKRAGGHSPHIHPWNFYLERLVWFHPAKSPVWSEALILALAVGGAVVSLVGRKSPLLRFLAFYTIILTAVYCVISYKTPWCLLGFFHGMIILAGVGAAALVNACRTRALKVTAVATLGVLTLQLSWQAWRASVVYAADPRNPYVYAQTSPDLPALMERIEGIAGVAPTGYDTVVKIIAPDNDYWPVPWYLRRFHHLGWYDRLPEDPFAPVVIISSKLDARLDDRSDRRWIMAGISELRPGTFFELYVELELWKAYVATLPRDRD
jgi:uncharacterized protein (TIGR03663 family)